MEVKNILNKGIDELAPVALSLISLVVMIGIGSVVITDLQDTTYTDLTVTGEQDTPAEPLPSNYTLDESSGTDFVRIEEDSVSVTLEDASAGSNVTLTEDTDYVVYEQDGKVELQSSPGGVTYNDSEDTVFTDYTYEEENTATGVHDKALSALATFSDFFVVIVVVAVAAVIFLLLQGLRRSGGKTMA